jgi:hypothetical protein
VLPLPPPVHPPRPHATCSPPPCCSYKALSEFSKEDARSQFLRILRTLPYGSSTFFTVKRIEDPIGLLPAKLVLGINKRGVHFFRWVAAHQVSGLHSMPCSTVGLRLALDGPPFCASPHHPPALQAGAQGVPPLR